MDVSSLTNDQLRNELIALGENPGPVMGTTRKVYEAKLTRLLGAQISPPPPTPPKPQGDGMRSSPRKPMSAEKSPLYPDISRERDAYEDEIAEGEESFRYVSPEEEFELMTTRINSSSNKGSFGDYEDDWSSRTRLRNVESTSNQRQTSTASSFYATSPSNAVYASSKAQGGGGSMIWVKLAVGTILAIFVFMVLRQLNLGGGVNKEDAI